MTISPNPQYDLLAAFQAYAPGVVLQRQFMDAMAAQYAANGFMARRTGESVH